MGKIKKDIKELSKEAGGKNNAKKAAEQWFLESSKNIREGAVMTYGGRFRTGMIHVFRYDSPKNEATLEWWDRNPVVLALDPAEGNDFGINLNLLPVAFKEDMLDMVYERMAGQIKSKTRSGMAIAQGQIPLTYTGAKSFLEQFGLGFAVRQYIPNRKSNQKIVNYENWARIALCDFMELNGASVGKIRAQFKNHLKK
jgi:hypothetical protein